MVESAFTAEMTPAQARKLQKQLAERVMVADAHGMIQRVAGIDVGYDRASGLCRAAIVVLELPELTMVDSAIAQVPVTFPYLSGLLSFREIPAIMAAFDRLQSPPDAILCDGQGVAHPRRFGIACHLGVLTDIPAIGVAKTRLTGKHGPAPDVKGGWTPLTVGDAEVGAVLRSRVGVKPIFVSVGHRFTLPMAIDLVMACVTRYRLPETTRMADRMARIGGRS